MGKDIVENRKNSLVCRSKVEAENNYTFSNINCFVLSQWMLKNIKTDKDKTAGKEAQLIVNTTRTNAVNLDQR